MTLPRAGHLAKRKALVREVTKNPMAIVTEFQKSSAVMGELAGRTTMPEALHQSGLMARAFTLIRR